MFIHLCLGGNGVGIDPFMNLEGCWVSVADFERNGGPKLAFVQELNR